MAYQVSSTGVITDNRILSNVDSLTFAGGSLLVGGPYTLDFNNAHYELSGGSSISFTNQSSSTSITKSMIVILTGTGFTWPASVLWTENDEPPQSSGQDVFEITSYNGALYGSMVIYNGL